MDYSFSAMNQTFSESIPKQCVNISIVNDNLLEVSESFFVHLTAFRPNIILNPNRTTVNIADNDGELSPQITVSVTLVARTLVVFRLVLGVESQWFIIFTGSNNEYAKPQIC